MSAGTLRATRRTILVHLFTRSIRHYGSWLRRSGTMGFVRTGRWIYLMGV